MNLLRRLTRFFNEPESTVAKPTISEPIIVIEPEPKPYSLDDVLEDARLQIEDSEQSKYLRINYSFSAACDDSAAGTASVHPRSITAPTNVPTKVLPDKFLETKYGHNYGRRGIYSVQEESVSIYVSKDDLAKANVNIETFVNNVRENAYKQGRSTQFCCYLNVYMDVREADGTRFRMDIQKDIDRLKKSENIGENKDYLAVLYDEIGRPKVAKAIRAQIATVKADETQNPLVPIEYFSNRTLTDNELSKVFPELFTRARTLERQISQLSVVRKSEPIAYAAAVDSKQRLMRPVEEFSALAMRVRNEGRTGTITRRLNKQEYATLCDAYQKIVGAKK